MVLKLSFVACLALRKHDGEVLCVAYSAVHGIGSTLVLVSCLGSREMANVPIFARLETWSTESLCLVALVCLKCNI